MIRSLYTRLSLGLFCLLVIIGVAYIGIGLVSLQQYNASVNQELHRNLARDLVADRNLVDQGRIDREALKALFELYMTINPGIEIYLLDEQGKILAYSADPEKIKRNRVSLQPIRRFLRDSESYPVLGDDPRSHERRKVFSVTPVPSADNIQGYLYVVLRGEEYDAVEVMAREGHVIGMSVWTLVLSLAIGLVAGLTVFRLLTRRLERLTRIVESFEHGGAVHGDRLTWQGERTAMRDEIDYLGTTFDRMAERIEQQMEELRDKDNQRRKLVAQVSHDLRTPLTSMQGFIESLKLRRQRMSDEEQEQFLDTALREGQRLNRLVNELFELASLEARERRPCLEPFGLVELLYDVVGKHRGEAQKAEVALTVTGSLTTELAYGDIGMTERVLDNLINNALRFAPGGSTIELYVAELDEWLCVTVADEGPGIPEAERERIFDPLYRIDHESSASHAGLGLTIARRMMEVQGGYIDVHNRNGQGACFTIGLPRSSEEDR